MQLWWILWEKNIGLQLILCFFFSFQNLKLHIGSFFLTFIYHAIPALLSEMGAKGLFFFKCVLCSWGRQNFWEPCGLCDLLDHWACSLRFKARKIKNSLWAKANVTYYQSWATSCQGINRAWQHYNIEMKYLFTHFKPIISCPLIWKLWSTVIPIHSKNTLLYKMADLC